MLSAALPEAEVPLDVWRQTFQQRQPGQELGDGIPAGLPPLVAPEGMQWRIPHPRLRAPVDAWPLQPLAPIPMRLGSAAALGLGLRAASNSILLAVAE